MPTSTSAKNLRHFNQLFISNKFQKFDYGLGNWQHYGQSTPPEYPLQNITHPALYIIYSDNDYFVPVTGIQTLETLLKTAKEFYQVSDPLSNHMDVLTGKDVAVEVNIKVLSILETYN